jgi:hypothetical protein
VITRALKALPEDILNDSRARALRQLVAHYLLSTLDPFVNEALIGLRAARREGIGAILSYGSCLFEKTRTATSIPDFYILTTDLYRFHRSLLHAGLNLFLPPNAYYLSFSGAEGALGCKICVMSLSQYTMETSALAQDIHHLGRFSKRFILCYSKDEAITDQVIRGAMSAMLSLVPYTLALLPGTFSLEEFVLKLLSLSYLGEQRVTEPDKIKNLFLGAREYYLQIYPLVLELYRETTCTRLSEQNGIYRQPAPTPLARLSTKQFLRKSRWRGVLRWPKYVLTVDKWLEYLQEKLLRHQGITLQLTKMQRRFPLIFGWGAFFELRRKGVVK